MVEIPSTIEMSDYNDIVSRKYFHSSNQLFYLDSDCEDNVDKK